MSRNTGIVPIGVILTTQSSLAQLSSSPASRSSSVASSSAPIQIRTAPAGRGADWIVDAFSLFKNAPKPWLAIAALLLLAAYLANRLGSVGDLLGNLLAPVITGGIILGCQAQQRGEPFEIAYLWRGFSSPHFGRLLLIGLAWFGMTFIAVAVFLAVVGGTALGTVIATQSFESLQLGTTALYAGLLTLILLAVAAGAAWFAAPLIVLYGMEPIPALKASLLGCVKNPLSLLVNGILTVIILLIATIPLGLGLLVAIPILFASQYFAQRDIFVADITPQSTESAQI
jgi:uncharacterized membrane protein